MMYVWFQWHIYIYTHTLCVCVCKMCVKCIDFRVFVFLCVCVQVHLLVQLALADLLAALILISATVMNNISTVYSVAICQYSLPLSLVRNGYFHFVRLNSYLYK